MDTSSEEKLIEEKPSKKKPGKVKKILIGVGGAVLLLLGTETYHLYKSMDYESAAVKHGINSIDYSLSQQNVLLTAIAEQGSLLENILKNKELEKERGIADFWPVSTARLDSLKRTADFYGVMRQLEKRKFDECRIKAQRYDRWVQKYGIIYNTDKLVRSIIKPGAGKQITESSEQGL